MINCKLCKIDKPKGQFSKKQIKNKKYKCNDCQYLESNKENFNFQKEELEFSGEIVKFDDVTCKNFKKEMIFDAESNKQVSKLYQSIKKNDKCEIMYDLVKRVKNKQQTETKARKVANRYTVRNTATLKDDMESLTFIHMWELLDPQRNFTRKDRSEIQQTKVQEFKVDLGAHSGLVFDPKLEIWRDIRIPCNFTFAQLGRFITQTESFTGHPFHQFRFQLIIESKKKIQMFYVPSLGVDSMFNFLDSVIFKGQSITYKDAQKVKLEDFQNMEGTKGQKLIFEQDLGCRWLHDVIFLKEGDASADCDLSKDLIVLDGKGTGPPEDSGWAKYWECLEIVSKKDSPLLAKSDFESKEDCLVWMSKQTHNSNAFVVNRSEIKNISEYHKNLPWFDIHYFKPHLINQEIHGRDSFNCPLAYIIKGVNVKEHQNQNVFKWYESDFSHEKISQKYAIVKATENALKSDNDSKVIIQTFTQPCGLNFDDESYISDEEDQIEMIKDKKGLGMVMDSSHMGCQKKRKIVYEKKNIGDMNMYEETCAVCLDETHLVDTILQPCWHQNQCQNCARKIKQCAICRADIKERKKFR